MMKQFMGIDQLITGGTTLYFELMLKLSIGDPENHGLQY